MMTGFRVQLPKYTGPVDILVELVRTGEIGILDIALSDIALSYLETIRSDTTLDFDEVGEFVVFLSILMEMKSRALLPDTKRTKRSQPTPREKIHRPTLHKQVEDAKRFQEAAEFLAERAKVRRACLRRLADDLAEPAAPTTEPSIRELEIWDLVTAFSRLMRQGLDPSIQRIPRDTTPISVYQDRVEAKVLESGRITLTELFSGDVSRPQRIGKFLAVLELIKSQRLWIEWNAEAQDLVLRPPTPGGKPTAAPAIEPAPALSLRALPAARIKIASDENSEIWPDLPDVPELDRKPRGWANFRRISRRQDPPQPFATN